MSARSASSIAPGGGLLGAIGVSPSAAAAVAAGVRWCPGRASGATADAVEHLAPLPSKIRGRTQITQMAQQVAQQLGIPVEMALQIIMQALQRQQATRRGGKMAKIKETSSQ